MNTQKNNGLYEQQFVDIITFRINIIWETTNLNNRFYCYYDILSYNIVNCVINTNNFDNLITK